MDVKLTAAGDLEFPSRWVRDRERHEQAAILLLNTFYGSVPTVPTVGLPYNEMLRSGIVDTIGFSNAVVRTLKQGTSLWTVNMVDVSFDGDTNTLSTEVQLTLLFDQEDALGTVVRGGFPVNAGGYLIRFTGSNTVL